MKRLLPLVLLGAGICAQDTSAPPAPETPFFRQIDYSAPENLLKIALFVGSVLLAVRAFRDMKGW